ncbi:methyltransferase domain-containing protein [Candidatus Microgenomates bacterium]|nr:methyltransferase domain-containing protein [Candidatus Microgenomates bacterium]
MEKVFDLSLNVFFAVIAITWWVLLVILSLPFFILGLLYNPRPFRKIYEQIHAKRLRKIFYTPVRGLDEYLKPGLKVLDLGSGTGLRAEEIANYYKVKVTLCDIDDFNRTNLPLKIFDGKNLPFPDKSFDVVLISFVLHHTDHPVELLKEAKRVAVKNVIIYEDNKKDMASDFFTMMHGRSYNWFHKIKSSCTFYSKEEWERIFAKLGYKIVVSLTRWRSDSLTYPVKECLFILAN